MTIDLVLQLPQAGAQHSRRILTNSDGTRFVYEDRNRDGKLDLYSITTKAQRLFEPNTRITSYYDNDGDGLCDERKDVIIQNKNIPEGVTLNVPNIVRTDGKELNAFTERTVFKNMAEKPKMNEILYPKEIEVNSGWLF